MLPATVVTPCPLPDSACDGKLREGLYGSSWAVIAWAGLLTGQGIKGALSLCMMSIAGLFQNPIHCAEILLKLASACPTGYIDGYALTFLHKEASMSAPIQGRHLH